MSDKPMHVEAEAVLQMTLGYFRDRIPQEPAGRNATRLTAEDIAFLEEAMRNYAAVRCNEHMRERALLPSQDQ